MAHKNCFAFLAAYPGLGEALNANPASIAGNVSKGSMVEFMATLKRGNDAHFALYSRPTKARVLGAEERVYDLVSEEPDGTKVYTERVAYAAAVSEDDDGSKADAAREAGVSFLDWVA